MYLKSLENACHIMIIQEEYVLLLYYTIFPQMQVFPIHGFNHHRSKIPKRNLSIQNMYRLFGAIIP